MDIVLRTEQDLRDAEAFLLQRINQSRTSARAFLAAPFHFLREIGVGLEGDFASFAEIAMHREDVESFRALLSGEEPKSEEEPADCRVLSLVGVGPMPTPAELRERGVL